MKQSHQIDSESLEPLTALLEVFPGGFNAIADINARRATIDQILSAATKDLPANERVTTTSHFTEAANGDPAVEVRTYRPAQSDEVLPCLGFIHGGGFIIGSLDANDMMCELLSETLNVVVASIDYRKAPEDPYPAALNDCYAGLEWVKENTDTIKIDPDNIGLMGLSAGGGLVIAAALKIRDQGGLTLKYLMPIYPMIDDRNETASSKEITDVGLWDRAGNIEAWEWYLGGQEADAYAAPTRMQDLSGLAPTYISVGTFDMFRDEDIAFANRLMQAGVETELKVYPGAYHASEMFAADAQLSHRINKDRIEALMRFINRA